MVKQKLRRKLLYPLGIISLSLLTFLCNNFVYQSLLQKEFVHMLEVTYWNPTDTVDSHNPLNYVNNKFIKITLNGEVEDSDKLDSAQLAIRELILQKDTTLGIEFTFTNNAKYSSLVRLFNLCKKEGARTYLNHQNKFWVFNFSFTYNSIVSKQNTYIEL